MMLLLRKEDLTKRKLSTQTTKNVKKCPVKSKCTKAKHRTIKRYVHELCYEVEKIMDTPKGQKEYKQRSKTVEAQNGTFRRVYHFDEFSFRGLKSIQGVMFMIAGAYNAIRIYNITKNKGWDIYETVELIRNISMNATNKIPFKKKIY